jgi:multidrug efflux system outer membrane protein
MTRIFSKAPLLMERAATRPHHALVTRIHITTRLSSGSKRLLTIAATLAAGLTLSACSLPRPPSAASASFPTSWHAPLPPSVDRRVEAGAATPIDPSLPHGGTEAGLSHWWQRLDDPLMGELIAAAEGASPTVAQAASRIAQAQATRVAAGAKLGPTADASANLSRGFQSQFLSVATTAQAVLQASWEPDIFGGNRAARDAAQARLKGAQAGWHDARVSVAAETANQLTNWRACREQLEVVRGDAESRGESARLSALSTRAGFTAPADNALARASAADATNQLLQQQAQCDVATKALVALTGLNEENLKQKLSEALIQHTPSALFTIATLPAQVLAQRPDVAAAAAEVVATSADVGNVEAQRYPRLTLNGSIGRVYLKAPGISGSSSIWSIGPVQLQLPLFDGGQRRANAQSARARYDEAIALYRAKVRQAVQEVEQALVNLRATADRAGAAKTAEAGYQASFDGFQARYDAGLASRIQLEDARRTLLAAQTTQVNLKRERMAAWIALYRAAGGGWEASATSPADTEVASHSVSLFPLAHALPASH